MQTSDQGRAALKLEEGEVLKAYRDVVGVWTIGVGLTAASGVVKPKAGMVITAEESDALLSKALKQSYEPAVAMAMTITEGPVTRPAQHEFDAGVSFHFNTGAIGRASWVRLWKSRSGRSGIRAAFAAWSKAGGKVLPPLQARREREFLLLMDGIYRSPAKPLAAPHPVWAQWSPALSADEVRAVAAGLRELGYGPAEGSDPLRRDVVMAFQRDHALTPDGIIGRATQATVQRAVNARERAVAPIATTLAVTSAVASGLTDYLPVVPHGEATALFGSILWVICHGWSYRDIAAAKIALTFPRLAALLRSF